MISKSSNKVLKWNNVSYALGLEIKQLLRSRS
jgi:hypothetical protein